jgi:hypothetical protein
VITMQSAISVSFYKPEFGDFLYAPIDGEANGTTLSVLSALARLNIDPWLEAAALTALPTESAAHRLALLLARLPGSLRSVEDCEAIASRLAKLLPRNSKRHDATVANQATGQPGAPRFKFGVHLIYLALVIAFVTR